MDDDREHRELLRRQLRAERARLDGEMVRAASAAVCRHAAPLLARGGVLAIYAATQNEIDPAALARGPVAYPRLDGESLAFHLVDGPDALVSDRFGIAAPPADAPRVAPAIVIVPGVAFEPGGHRLGFGRGYYDAALAAHPLALRIGLAHSFQLVPALPRRIGDEPVDWIVTPDGARATGARALKEHS